MRSVHQICESLDPADGGAPVVAVHIAAAQAAAGSSAEIVLHGIRRRASVASPRDLVEIHHSLPGMGNVRVERHASARSLGRFLRGTVSAQDVVHLHGVWDLSLRLAGAASRRCGAAYVVTPHGMLDPWCLRQSRWKKRLVLAVAVRREARLAHARIHVPRQRVHVCSIASGCKIMRRIRRSCSTAL